MYGQKAANDENLNETLETVFRHIEESAKGSSSEGQFAGLFDDYDVNSNKLGATVAKRNEARETAERRGRYEPWRCERA